MRESLKILSYSQAQINTIIHEYVHIFAFQVSEMKRIEQNWCSVYTLFGSGANEEENIKEKADRHSTHAY